MEEKKTIKQRKTDHLNVKAKDLEVWFNISESTARRKMKLIRLANGKANHKHAMVTTFDVAAFFQVDILQLYPEYTKPTG